MHSDMGDVVVVVVVDDVLLMQEGLEPAGRIETELVEGHAESEASLDGGLTHDSALVLPKCHAISPVLPLSFFILGRNERMDDDL
jgi:hypothetical protein